MKNIKRVACLAMAGICMAAFVMGGCGKQEKESTSSEKKDSGIKIGVSSWVGYAPFFIAEEKGFFKDHGADVKIKTIESGADRRSAMASNKIQGMCTTVDTHIISDAVGVDVVQTLALDTSCGGDGLVAKKENQSIKDLKGKKIAIDTTSGSSYFWFQNLIKKEGMTISDFDIQSMGSGDAGAAFVAGEVDAAMTWEPWLTKASDTDFGYVMIDSSQTPGIIVDSIGFKKEFIEKNPEVVQAVSDAWYDALDYINENPDDAYQIMAKAMGQSVDEFKSSLEGVKYYDEAENKEYFDGQIYDIAEEAMNLWLDEGTISEKINVKDYINSDYITRTK